MSKKNRFLNLLALSGIAGPPVFVAVLGILGFLRPDYNHITQSMSELGEVGDPNSIIMNTLGFPLLGLFMIAFAVGLHLGIGKGSKIGPALVALSGVVLIFTGIFPCDPGCVDVSLTGYLHSVAAVVSSFTMMFAPLAVLPRLNKDPRWHSFSLYSLVTGIATGILSAVYGFGVFETWKGAMQRASTAVPLLWMEVMATNLLHLSNQSLRKSQ